MVTRWYSGIAKGAGASWQVAPGGTGVAGDRAGVVVGGPFQSGCVGICRDRDWDRIILKLFFLKAKHKEKWETSVANWGK